jgi:hypothetical protein
MAALARFSEEDACWWLDESATLTVLRKDDDSHPLYRIVISSAPDAEERRFLQSDFVKFSKLRDAQKTVERVLAPRGAFPPSYAKSRFGASLSRKELEKRTGLLEDYLAGALRSTASSDDPPSEADRSALLEALRLGEVDEVDEAAVADAARRRAESFSSDGSGDRRMAKSFSTAARGSARLAGADARPKSETAASAAAKKRGLGSATFSLSGFAKRQSEVGGADEHCLAPPLDRPDIFDQALTMRSASAIAARRPCPPRRLHRRALGRVRRCVRLACVPHDRFEIGG